jgi:hypothetical protein
MADRPADIVSPINGSVLPLKVSPADAAAAGRVPYDKPTPGHSGRSRAGERVRARL